jgi:hypothetical protein
MDAAQPLALLDEITDFLASRPTPEEIIAYKPSEGLEHRALELLALNRDNRLSADERLELEDFRRIEHLMTILKAKARLKLSA